MNIYVLLKLFFPCRFILLIVFQINLQNLLNNFLLFLNSNSTTLFSPAIASQHMGLQQQEPLHCHDLAYCSCNLLSPFLIHSLPR